MWSRWLPSMRCQDVDVEGFAPLIVLAAKAGHGTVLKTTQCDSDEEIEA